MSGSTCQFIATGRHFTALLTLAVFLRLPRLAGFHCFREMFHRSAESIIDAEIVRQFGCNLYGFRK